jgi:hypothetical protein
MRSRTERGSQKEASDINAIQTQNVDAGNQTKSFFPWFNLFHKIQPDGSSNLAS